MEVGDVATMTSCTVVMEGHGRKMSLSYRANKGEKLHFLFLGAGSPTKPLDPIAVLKAMGWNPTEELTQMLEEQKQHLDGNLLIDG
jgi:hypothetical protein